MTFTENIVQRMLSIKYEDLPLSAIEMTNFMTMDSIGNILAASQMDLGQKIIGIDKRGEVGSSTVLGTDQVASLSRAVFINSSLAQLLDFDDTHEMNTFAVGHPGPAIVPISLAIGERFKTKGKNLARAIILGYTAVQNKLKQKTCPSNCNVFGGHFGQVGSAN